MPCSQVRHELKVCGGIDRLVELLASKNHGVQEWSAYALRKACSRSSDLELGQTMIAEAGEFISFSSVLFGNFCRLRRISLRFKLNHCLGPERKGAVRKLIKMLDLRPKDAVEEAQQTLDYFGVDDAAVLTIREQVALDESHLPCNFCSG
jgi:hypothetical protein